MYDRKKVAFFCSNKDPVPVSLQSHVIYQFECPGCKAKYIGKTNKCLELRLNEHSDFRTSAVGKHLYECEYFHHIVKLFNISVYSNLEPSFIETWYHISSAISRNTRIIDKNNNCTQLCFLESLYIKRLRACSHEPGTVNYPGASVTSRSHDDMLSLGNGKFVVVRSLRIYLNSFSFYTNCYRE